MKKYFWGKLLQGIIASIYTFLALKFIPFINLVLDCEDNNLYVRDEIIENQRELKIRKDYI